MPSSKSNAFLTHRRISFSPEVQQVHRGPQPVNVRKQGQVQQVGAGQNTLRLWGIVTRVVGSRYADVLIGRDTGSILVGGKGNDVLIGGAGRDLLIGGKGDDILIGGGEQDILIAGKTTFDANPQALAAVLREWSANRPLSVRKKNLPDGSGSADRLNGNIFLDPGVTVLKGSVLDQLFSSPGPDWLWK